MLDAILTSPFFGLVLSAAAWCAGLWVQKKTGWVLCNPLIIAGVLIIAVLAVFHIPLEHYNQGASLIQMMLGPVTAVLAPGCRVYDKMISNCEEARARHAFLTGVSFDGDRRAEELFDLLLTVPSTTEIFSPLLLNLPLQLLAYYIADLLGREVDQPRNLAKSVTVE